jgi:hypothetical protein
MTPLGMVRVHALHEVAAECHYCFDRVDMDGAVRLDDFATYFRNPLWQRAPKKVLKVVGDMNEPMNVMNSIGRFDDGFICRAAIIGLALFDRFF